MLYRLAALSWDYSGVLVAFHRKLDPTRYIFFAGWGRMGIPLPVKAIVPLF